MKVVDRIKSVTEQGKTAFSFEFFLMTCALDQIGEVILMLKERLGVEKDKKLPTVDYKVDKMEEVAQGRIWTRKDAHSRGLVDALGGLSRAIAIAKHKANIPHERHLCETHQKRRSSLLKHVQGSIKDGTAYYGAKLSVDAVTKASTAQLASRRD